MHHTKSFKSLHFYRKTILLRYLVLKSVTYFVNNPFSLLFCFLCYKAFVHLQTKKNNFCTSAQTKKNELFTQIFRNRFLFRFNETFLRSEKGPLRRRKQNERAKKTILEAITPYLPFSTNRTEIGFKILIENQNRQSRPPPYLICF